MLRAARPERLRQDHDAALHCGTGADRRAARSRSAAGRLRPGAWHLRADARARDRHGVPVLRDLAAFRRVRERRLSAAGAAAAPGPPARSRRASWTCSRWSAWPTWRAARRRGSPAGSSSASRSRARIVRRPALLLLDEPLSNLDARLREGMRKELSELIARIGITALLVTHDQAEAFAMAQRVAVMNNGHDRAGGHAARHLCATARRVHRAVSRRRQCAARPDRARSGAHATVRLEGGQGIEIATDIAEGEVELILRPEQLTILTAPADGANAGKVLSSVFQGDSIEYGIDNRRVTMLRAVARPELESGARYAGLGQAGRYRHRRVHGGIGQAPRVCAHRANNFAYARPAHHTNG